MNKVNCKATVGLVQAGAPFAEQAENKSAAVSLSASADCREIRRRGDASAD